MRTSLPRRRVASLVLALTATLAATLAGSLIAAGGPASAMRKVEPAPGVRNLPTGTDADYQLGGAARVPAHVGIVERDRTDAPDPGRYNICYLNGFQTQDGERRFWNRHESLLLHDHGRRVVDANWGEFLLDVRTPATRAALARIVGRWITGCARDGFDAVELDNLDSYTRSHHLMDRGQAVAFARLLVSRAHDVGLAVAQKNLAQWDGARAGFDFAVAESCARYDECGDYVAHYGDRVVMVEYRDVDFRRACAGWGDRVAVVRRDLELRPAYRPRYC